MMYGCLTETAEDVSIQVHLARVHLVAEWGWTQRHVPDVLNPGPASLFRVWRGSVGYALQPNLSYLFLLPSFHKNLSPVNASHSSLAQRLLPEVPNDFSWYQKRSILTLQELKLDFWSWVTLYPIATTNLCSGGYSTDGPGQKRMQHMVLCVRCLNLRKEREYQS